MNKKKIIIIGILILIFALCFVPSQKYNSKNKLNIKTYYGDEEPYHPKVINFAEKWNGYKYWMSYTPYPKEDDTKENPIIVVSNDLINWEAPFGEKRPLDEPKNIHKRLVYNSDSHLVYNTDLDRLECYWRYVDDMKNKVIIYRRTTTDGKNWTEKEAVIEENSRSNKDYVSLAIIFEDGIYKMWYVDKGNKLKYETSADGINWENETLVNIKYEEKVKTWHIDVIHTEKGYEMIAVAYKKWTLHNSMSLYYSTSDNGIDWNIGKKILSPTTKTGYWDNKGIYRSSFIYEDGIYYVYYSGTSKSLHHGIGFMYGKDILNLKNNKTNFKNKKSVEKLLKRIEEEKSN